MMLVGGPPLRRPVRACWQAKNIPFVNTWVLDPRPPLRRFSDNREIGRALARHLLDLGHVGIRRDRPGHRQQRPVRAGERVIGIREALGGSGAWPCRRSG